MKVNLREFSLDYDFYIEGASYAGNPKNNTMMFLSKKVEYLVEKLKNIEECLVFLENGMEINNNIKTNNCIIFSDNPQFEYAKYANEYADRKQQSELKYGYTLTKQGYYIGKNSVIGNSAYIEPNVVIGHNVRIGDNAIILSGAVVKNAIIGDNFYCNENAVIGNNSFTMATDDHGNRYRIPSLGKVIIGDNVEIGACDDVARGMCGNTVLDDSVKLDSLVYVGHEAYLERNTEVTAGTIIAGFAHLREGTYVGINSSIKNRVTLGENSVIGMGTNVTKNVEANKTMVGNPAREYIKNR